MSGAWIALWLLLALALCAAGAEPIDPLARREEDAGSYTWQVGLGYIPEGHSGTAVDAWGIPYNYTRIAHGAELSLSATFNVSPHWKTGIEVADTTWLIRERRNCPQETVGEEYRRREFAYNAFCEARLAPGSALEPRVTLSVGDPRCSAVSLSASVLRDPMVLFGRIGYAGHAEPPEETVYFSLAGAFVANAWITVSTTAGWEVPVREPALPGTTLGMLVQYDLDIIGDLQLKWRVTLHLQGGSTLLGVSLELAGRHS
ncbi:MAG: hypothetical protein R6U88_00675 [Candidatus Bipolaricaulota bacterium]